MLWSRIFFRDDSELDYQSENVAGKFFLPNLHEIGNTTCAWFHPNNVDILYSSKHLDPLSQKKKEAELEKRIKNTEKNILGTTIKITILPLKILKQKIQEG